MKSQFIDGSSLQTTVWLNKCTLAWFVVVEIDNSFHQNLFPPPHFFKKTFCVGGEIDRAANV